jgi:hypothetical protein
MFHYNLWQINPAADTQTILFSVLTPGINTIVLLDTLYISNLDFQNWEDLVSVRVVKSGDAVSNDNALLNNYPIAKWENILKWTIYMFEGDSLVVYSKKWNSSFQAFGRYDIHSFRTESLRNKLINNPPLSASEKEELALLGWGSYVDVTQNCNCP